MADYDLKQAISKVGASPMNFGLYKGEDADQVLISSAAPSAKQLAAITKECGKNKRILKGVCFKDGDQFVFAIKSPPAPQWKMQITNVLKLRKCTSALPIELRQLGPNDSDEVGGEGGGTDGTGANGTTLLSIEQVRGISTEWNAAHTAAVQGVEQLVSKLQATGEEGANQASGLVEQLAAGFPEGLGEILASLEAAVTSSDTVTAAMLQGQAKSATDSCLAYLSANNHLIGLCEKNPFGANVAISKPLTEALQSISNRIK